MYKVTSAGVTVELSDKFSDAFKAYHEATGPASLYKLSDSGKHIQCINAKGPTKFPVFPEVKG